MKAYTDRRSLGERPVTYGDYRKVFMVPAPLSPTGKRPVDTKSKEKIVKPDGGSGTERQ